MRPDQPNAGGGRTLIPLDPSRAVPGRPAFGTRRIAPPPFAPLLPENPLRAWAMPHLELLKSDWLDFRADATRWGRKVSRAFGGLVARAHSPRKPAIEIPAPDLARPFAGEGRETMVRFFAYAGGIGALSFLVAHLLQPPSVEAAVEPAPRPEWLTVAKPYPAFLLSLPEFGEEPRYAIQRHVSGGGRKDIMTFGEPGRSLRYVMVEIYRPGRELDRFADPASEIAARAGNLGPAGAVRAALPIDTKFGSVSTVEFAVGQFGVGHCIGFVHVDGDPALQIAGISCSMNSLVNRSAVACTLDRLSLMSAGSDPDIAKYFAQAEIRRTFCGQRDPLLYATPKRDYPVSVPPAIRLRGQVSSR